MIDCTKFVETLNGKPLAVFGLGMSNQAVIKALAAAGATLVTADDREPETTKTLLMEDMRRFAALALAPGVKPSHPVVQKARWAGIEILCDVEILYRCGHGRRTIGITGTNGKSTTTALIGHILNENGIKAVVGGNIGRPVLDLDLPPPGGVLVLELSSYQLDLCPTFAPDVSILLNITPDHLDHHGTMEKYTAAKARIFRGPGEAVIGRDDAICRRVSDDVRERDERAILQISAQDPGLPAGAALPGLHNAQNIAAAAAVAQIMGVDPAGVARAVASFPGLPHRQQLVRVTGGVRWINDSKATNAEAAAKALACYDDIYWIAGGQPKDGGLAGLESFAGRIRHAFLIGQAQDEFADWMTAQGIPFTKSGTLAQAVQAARDMTRGRAGTVLLSPACASFDQFKNFEDRGAQFAALVQSFGGNGHEKVFQQG